MGIKGWKAGSQDGFVAYESLTVWSIGRAGRKPLAVSVRRTTGVQPCSATQPAVRPGSPTPIRTLVDLESRPLFRSPHRQRSNADGRALPGRMLKAMSNPARTVSAAKYWLPVLALLSAAPALAQGAPRPLPTLETCSALISEHNTPCCGGTGQHRGVPEAVHQAQAVREQLVAPVDAS